MRFAVVGDRGMFGRDMLSLLQATGLDAAGFNRDLINLDDPVDDLVALLDEFDVIINAVAYTAVDRAESEPELAMKVNGEYAGKLATVAARVGARFVHISTDYVFDGNQIEPYKTTSETHPTSSYGKSKQKGEQLVAESGSSFTIFRTAWLYGKYGACFPRTIFEKAKSNQPLRVVSDQFGQPTWTKDLAELIIAHQDFEESVSPRIVHATASGSCTWYEFACEIALSLGYDPDQVIIPISTSEYPTPAKRPAYSGLDNKNERGLVIGDWKERWREAAPLVLAKHH